jgi:hypothetical protein
MVTNPNLPYPRNMEGKLGLEGRVRWSQCGLAEGRLVKEGFVKGRLAKGRG